MYISVDKLFEQWQDENEQLFLEKWQTVFKIPELMPYTLRLLTRKQSGATKETSRLLETAQTFMPVELYEALVQFEKSDRELAVLGADLSRHEKFWQGYTGAEAHIFIRALRRLWDDPSYFLQHEISAEYEQQLRTADIKVGKLSPAIHTAEVFRSLYMKQLADFQELSQQRGGE